MSNGSEGVLGENYRLAEFSGLQEISHGAAEAVVWRSGECVQLDHVGPVDLAVDGQRSIPEYGLIRDIHPVKGSL